MINWKDLVVESHSVTFDLQTAVKVGVEVESIGGDSSAFGDSFHCRDGLVHHLRDELGGFGVGINLFDDETRQPGLTRLLGCYDGVKAKAKINPRRLLHTLDCVVGLPALLLNPDRFGGNWWKTTPEELTDCGDWGRGEGGRRFAYYGIDNTIVYHPAILSILTGLFRQALTLEFLGMNHDLKSAASRADVTSVLSDSDSDGAWELVEAVRPWIQADLETTRFPIAKNEWTGFRNLHQALYRLGFRRVFGTLEEGWALNRPYMQVNGVKTFLESGGKEKVQALAKLKARREE